MRISYSCTPKLILCKFAFHNMYGLNFKGKGGNKTRNLHFPTNAEAFGSRFQ